MTGTIDRLSWTFFILKEQAWILKEWSGLLKRPAGFWRDELVRLKCWVTPNAGHTVTRDQTEAANLPRCTNLKSTSQTNSGLKIHFLLQTRTERKATLSHPHYKNGRMKQKLSKQETVSSSHLTIHATLLAVENLNKRLHKIFFTQVIISSVHFPNSVKIGKQLKIYIALWKETNYYLRKQLEKHNVT